MTELLTAIFGLLTAIVVYLQLKKKNDGTLIEQKHELAMKLEAKQEENWKLQFENVTRQMLQFESLVKSAMAEFERARKEIMETNKRWEEANKSLITFTTRLKSESEFTDSKIRKVEGMIMANDKKLEDLGRVILKDQKNGS